MSLYIKISDYFTINNITVGLFIAFLSAGAIYLDWLGLVNYFINTILGLLTLYLLLISDKKRWLWAGFWIGLLWFWWMCMSFKHYDMVWAIPLVILVIGLIYALVFYAGAKIAEVLENRLKINALFGKALFILILSAIHPLGFDWFKPELIFTNAYLGIEKWQFGLVLLAMVLSIYKKQLLFLLLTLGAYPFASHFQSIEVLNPNIELTNYHINVIDKWKPELQHQHIGMVFSKIDEAIKAKKELIIFPESIFALFLNYQPQLMSELQARSNDITIVVGALYWDKGIPRNSTYIFKDGQFSVANKVVLVPFGEQNPLPKWMGKWVNKIFFDGAPDYVASADVTDYEVNGTTYRNAICFEATSERLYEGNPKIMVVLSNNGWVVPSIEPTQQKILLQYYSKKYGTTIYHSVNMSDSYIVQNGKIIQ